MTKLKEATTTEVVAASLAVLRGFEAEPLLTAININNCYCSSNIENYLEAIKLKSILYHAGVLTTLKLKKPAR